MDFGYGKIILLSTLLCFRKLFYNQLVYIISIPCYYLAGTCIVHGTFILRLSYVYKFEWENSKVVEKAGKTGYSI